jgi:hypothetical protein
LSVTLGRSSCFERWPQFLQNLASAKISAPQFVQDKSCCILINNELAAWNYAMPLLSVPELFVEFCMTAGERKRAPVDEKIANMSPSIQQVAVRDNEVRHLAGFD